ncbi:hypothetical protein, partial [Mycobacterium persicum]|uniref:hypothetical protein n=1 Tax=Mycobacterium persicum TaxID=1487726 RepID=UPI0013C342B1
MPVDLPPGRWSALLVGPWWCARPDAPTAGVTYWRQAGEVKRQEAYDLQNARSQLGVNQGRTADDLLERYWRGEQRLSTIAHQCQVKSEQSDRVADAVNHLRDRLTDIAQSGNNDIDRILADKGSTETKVAAVNAVIAEKNASAAHAGGIAMSNIIDATQRVLDETIGGDARTWLQDHGVNLDAALPSRAITAAELDSEQMPSPTAPLIGNATTAPGVSQGDTEATMALTNSMMGDSRTDPKLPPPPGTGVPTMSATGPLLGDTRSVPGPPSAPCTVAPLPQPSGPALAVGDSSLPGISTPGATGIPAAASAPLSPQSLSQSFATGMMTGAPAAAGAQSLSEGTIHAATEPLAPTTPPATAPIA